MFDDKNFLAIIPARGGSKGIPGKNIVNVEGKPLIAYTIESALKSRYIDKVIVSTDCQDIASVSSSYGAEVPFLRPKSLATDHSKTIDAILYTIERMRTDGYNFDYVITLQPTQPLRKSFHIDEAIERIINEKGPSLVSVSKVKESPVLMRTIENGHLLNILDINSTLRRQDFPEYYIVNGAIYINKTGENLNQFTSLNDNKIPYIMEEDYNLDIDTFKDLNQFREIMKKSKNISV